MRGNAIIVAARNIALVAVTAVAALAATTGANAVGQLTKPRYIAKADALCAAADAKVTKLGPMVPASRAVAVGTKVLAIDRGALAALRALTPPASQQAAVAKLMTLATAAINTGIAGVVTAARSGSASGFSAAVKRAQLLINKAHAAARAFGLSACASW